MSTTLATTATATAGKYLSFRLAGQEYGIEIVKVQEINRQLEATRIPGLPATIRGVINLRGKIVPVMDLRRRFGMEPAPDGERTCNIVVRLSREGTIVTMGLIVDEVTEVRPFAQEQISPPPELGGVVDLSYVTGVARLEEGIVILLDVERLVTIEEAGMLADLAGPEVPEQESVLT